MVSVPEHGNDSVGSQGETANFQPVLDRMEQMIRVVLEDRENVARVNLAVASTDSGSSSSMAGRSAVDLQPGVEHRRHNVLAHRQALNGVRMTNDE